MRVLCIALSLLLITSGVAYGAETDAVPDTACEALRAAGVNTTCGLSTLQEQVETSLAVASPLEQQKFSVEQYNFGVSHEKVGTTNATRGTNATSDTTQAASANDQNAQASQSTNGTVAPPSTTNATNDTADIRYVTKNLTVEVCHSCMCLNNGTSRFCPCEMDLVQLCSSDSINSAMLNGSVQVAVTQMKDSKGRWVTIAASFINESAIVLPPVPAIQPENITNPFFVRSQYQDMLKLLKSRALRNNFDDALYELTKMLNRLDRHPKSGFAFPKYFIELLENGDQSSQKIYELFGQQPRKKTLKRLQFVNSGAQSLTKAVEGTKSLIWNFLVEMATTKRDIKQHNKHYRKQMKLFIDDVFNARSLISIYEKPFNAAVQALEQCSGTSTETLQLAQGSAEGVGKFIVDSDKVLFHSNAYQYKTQGFPRVLKTVADLESQLRVTVDDLTKHNTAVADFLLNDLPSIGKLLSSSLPPRCSQFGVSGVPADPVDWTIPQSILNKTAHITSPANNSVPSMKNWKAEAAALKQDSKDLWTQTVANIQRLINNKAVTKYVGAALNMYQSLNQSVCAIEQILQNPLTKIREEHPDRIIMQKAKQGPIFSLAKSAANVRQMVTRVRKATNDLITDGNTYFTKFRQELGMHASVLQGEMQTILLNTTDLTTTFEILYRNATLLKGNLKLEAENCANARPLLLKCRKGVSRAKKFFLRSIMMMSRWRNIHSLAYVEHYATFSSWLDEYQDDERTFYRSLIRLKEKADEVLDHIGQFSASVYEVYENRQNVCPVF